MPAGEVTDLHAPLTEAWRPDHLGDRLRKEVGDEQKARRLESELLARLSGREGLDDRVQQAVSLFQREKLDVDAVAARVDVSRQHLIRLFRQHVGLGPKQFARVMRMQRLRSRLKNLARPDWASLALDAGYYDQAHMIAECRLLTGVTPTQLERGAET